jgi:hypothetical protein
MDGLSIKLENGAKLDRLLLKVERQSIASRLVNSSLKKGATTVSKEIKTKLPKDKGELKRSLKTKLMKNSDRKTFMAGVFFKFSRTKGQNDGEGAWYHHLALLSHKTRGDGFVRNTNPVPRVVKKSEPAVRRRIGESLAEKIASQIQKQIDSI